MDLNGDGRLDVISGRYSPGIVTFFEGSENGFLAGRTIEEIDETQDGDGFSMLRAMATANFTDWDGDGDYDMILGNVKGAVFLNLNRGTSTHFDFGMRVPLQADGEDIKVVQKSDPLPVDWDGDGILDLLVGDESADITFFKGKGDGAFHRGVSIFSGLPLISGISYRDAVAQLEGAKKVPGYRLRLEVTDWNEDGKLDLLVGNCEPGDEGTTGYVYLFLRK